ncbi:MAG: flagellar basal body rod protein FlgC [Planctomycetota bacterium]|jgi:flagellar basal-body rod protein FlgC
MAVENVFGPIDIAISGLRAQNKQVEVITSNVANVRNTDAGKGEPYRRREALFASDDEEMGGVALDKIVEDMSEFYRIFDPGNPNADEQGYVRMPNVSLPTEMINLNIATRAYQANAAILKRYEQMVETALELLR